MHRTTRDTRANPISVVLTGLCTAVLITACANPRNQELRASIDRMHVIPVTDTAQCTVAATCKYIKDIDCTSDLGPSPEGCRAFISKRAALAGADTLVIQIHSYQPQYNILAMTAQAYDCQGKNSEQASYRHTLSEPEDQIKVIVPASETLCHTIKNCELIQSLNCASSRGNPAKYCLNSFRHRSVRSKADTFIQDHENVDPDTQRYFATGRALRCNPPPIANASKSNPN